jgi:hypothetical protein
MGYFIPNSWVILFVIIRVSKDNRKTKQPLCLGIRFSVKGYFLYFSGLSVEYWLLTRIFVALLIEG